MGRPSKPTIELFYSKIIFNEETWCWEFQGFISVAGYGEMSYKGKMQKAHRVSYQIHIGEIKEGMVIHHKCRNPKCCNPEHLEQVTVKQNAEYTIHKNSLKTHCPQGHEYSIDNLVKSTLNRRVCKICHKLKSREMLPSRRPYFKTWRLNNREKGKEYQRRYRESPKYLSKILLEVEVR